MKLPKINLNYKKIFANRTNVVLVGVLGIVVLGMVFAGVKVFSKSAPEDLVEVDMPFDPEGPYGLLVPRRDGNALILNITRASSYDQISYEMAYSSMSSGDEGEGMSVDRGVQGTLDTDNKNEYSQEILFGTCSKGDTFSTPHCVFDKGVENGTLLLKIQKGNMLYKMLTTWHLRKPDVALGVITSGDNHFTYKTNAGREELAAVGYTIVNDLSGVPKLPAGKSVLGKVYALNIPTARTMPDGVVTVELAENPTPDAQIAFYNSSNNEWQLLDTKINSSTLNAQGPGAGIYAVVVNAPAQ